MDNLINPTEPVEPTPTEVAPVEPQNIEPQTIIENKAPIDIIPNPEWMNSLPEAFKNSSDLAKYQSMEAFLEGHSNLSKKFSQKFEAPSEDAGDEAWNDWYKRLGRPESADKYNYNPELKEGETPVFNDEQMSSLKGAMYDLGLNQKQFDGLLKMYSESVSMQSKSEQEANETANLTSKVETMKVLEQEWGNNVENNLKLVQETFDKHGLSDTIVSLGLANDPNMVKFGMKLAELTGETKISGDSSTPAKGFQETIKDLRNSEAFKNVLHPDHKRVTSQIEELYKRYR